MSGETAPETDPAAPAHRRRRGHVQTRVRAVLELAVPGGTFRPFRWWFLYTGGCAGVAALPAAKVPFGTGGSGCTSKVVDWRRLCTRTVAEGVIMDENGRREGIAGRKAWCRGDADHQENVWPFGRKHARREVVVQVKGWPRKEAVDWEQTPPVAERVVTTGARPRGAGCLGPPRSRFQEQCWAEGGVNVLAACAG